MPSDSKTTDSPRPAATEAAMLSDPESNELWNRLMYAHQNANTAHDPQRMDAALAEIATVASALRAALNAAAPPSGQVCVEWAVLAGAAYLIRFGSEQSELRDTTLATLEALVEPYRVQFASADLGNGDAR